MKKSHSFSPKVLLVAVSFFVATDPILFRDNDFLFNLTLLALALVSIFSLKRRPLASWTFVVFALLATLSLLWTHDLEGTQAALPALWACLILGTTIPSFSSANVILDGISLGGAAGVALSWLLNRRSAEFDGALVGVYSHRNVLSTVAVVTFAALLVRLFSRTGKVSRFVSALGATFAFLTVLATKSTSAIITALIAVSLLVLMWLLRRLGAPGRFAVLPLALVLSLGFVLPWALDNEDAVAAAFGRSATLTGRTEIWDIALYVARDNLWFGMGWGGIWDGTVGLEIRSIFGYTTALSAHNGYLDVLLQVGIVGAVFFALGVMFTMVRAWRAPFSDVQMTWVPVVLSAILINNVSESLSTRPIGLFLIFLISSMTLVAGTTTPDPTGPRISSPRRWRSASSSMGGITTFKSDA